MIRVTRETHDAPTDIQARVGRAGGTNCYGEANFRVVWALRDCARADHRDLVDSVAIQRDRHDHVYMRRESELARLRFPTATNFCNVDPRTYPKPHIFGLYSLRGTDSMC